MRRKIVCRLGCLRLLMSEVLDKWQILGDALMYRKMTRLLACCFGLTFGVCPDISAARNAQSSASESVGLSLLRFNLNLGFTYLGFTVVDYSSAHGVVVGNHGKALTRTTNHEGAVLGRINVFASTLVAYMSTGEPSAVGCRIIQLRANKYLGPRVSRRGTSNSGFVHGSIVEVEGQEVSNLYEP